MHRVRVVVTVVGWLLFFFYLLRCCCSSTSPPERDQLQSDKTDLKNMAHITYSTLEPTQWNSQQLKRCFLFVHSTLCTLELVIFFSLFFYSALSSRKLCLCTHACDHSLNKPFHQSEIHSTNCPSHVIVWHIVHLWSRFV